VSGYSLPADHINGHHVLQSLSGIVAAARTLTLFAAGSASQFGIILLLRERPCEHQMTAIMLL
jgi:hypothetical protein